jgi:hypothetical protein
VVKHPTFLIDVASGKLVHEMQPRMTMSIVPVFSQDGNWLVFGGVAVSDKGNENRFEIWHVPSGRLYREVTDDFGSGFEWSAIALAPHGQMLAVADKRHAIVLLEFATGRRIATLPGHAGPLTALAFSHDGRRLVSASEDRTVLVWSLDRLARARLIGDDDRLWQDLAGKPDEAYPIVWKLVQSPKRAIALTQKRLPAEGPQELNRLIADLASPVYLKRNEAKERLTRLGLATLPVLQAALKRPKDLEQRRRLEDVLQAVMTQRPSDDLLRENRVIQMLEMMGTPEAQKEMQRLAQGSPDGTRTITARMALERMKKREAPR